MIKNESWYIVTVDLESIAQKLVLFCRKYNMSRKSGWMYCLRSIIFHISQSTHNLIQALNLTLYIYVQSI